MNIYEDYLSWKKENLDFIMNLIHSNSKSIARISHVIAVVDYLSEKQKALGLDLDSDEENIFNVGFDYIYDRILTLKLQFDNNFNKDIVLFNQFEKTLNLLLYINDFQDELLNAEKNVDKDMQKLDELENKVLTSLENKIDVPDGFFVMLDEITREIFERNHLELQLTEEIFYEIALYYNIYTDDDNYELKLGA